MIYLFIHSFTHCKGEKVKGSKVAWTDEKCKMKKLGTDRSEDLSVDVK
jgi:hypothetical protein